MADEMTQEQVLELQKKNCIFCRIVSGEMESKKVFEDEHFIGILDIRPAAQGHVLFLPKQHVPILPILPEEQIIDFFTTGTRLARAMQDAMISQRVTLFIASGYAAGQQAPHLMMHIIPREKGDGLDMLDLETLNAQQSDAIALSSLFAQATTQALVHRKRDDLAHRIHKRELEKPHMETPEAPTTVIHESPTKEETTEREEEFETPNEALQAALAMAPDLRRLIIAQPDLVMEYAQKSPKLSKLFEGVNIKALSIMLQRQEAQQPKQSDEQKTAAQMSDTELFAFIDGNEGMRTWLLDHPDELASRISENPRLQKFFSGIDIPELAKRYRAHRQIKGDG